MQQGWQLKTETVLKTEIETEMKIIHSENSANYYVGGK